jgi:hypothetical protein
LGRDETVEDDDLALWFCAAAPVAITRVTAMLAVVASEALSRWYMRSPLRVVAVGTNLAPPQ